MRNGAKPKVGYQSDLEETEHNSYDYMGRGTVDTPFLSGDYNQLLRSKNPWLENLIDDKAAKHNGSNSSLDYRTHFQTVAKLNKWTEEETGIFFLAASLRGQAQAVLGDLPGDSTD
jgi:hypothetical protein